jgi:hypothetical protein
MISIKKKKIEFDSGSILEKILKFKSKLTNFFIKLKNIYLQEKNFLT